MGVAGAELHERTDIQGGIRTMHELAVAVAATGRQVELRGAVSRPIARLPRGRRRRMPGAALRRTRRPGGRDIVVIPEGGEDPLRFARYVLSRARLVLAILAPTGQFGWPFVSPWKAEPHLTVPLDTLGRPEHFRAMASLGIDLWTHMTRIHELALAAGARCEFIGNGDPRPQAPASPKDTPVVFLEASRWRPLRGRGRRADAHPRPDDPGGRPGDDRLQSLPGPRCCSCPRAWRATAVFCARRARWAPSWSASRARSTPWAWMRPPERSPSTRLQEMAGTVEDLLADPGRLLAISEAGRASARAQLDWPRYVDRVDRAITATEEREDDAGASARAEFGERIGVLLDERIRAIDRVGELDVHLADAGARIAVLDGELESARQAMAELGSQRGLLESQLSAGSAPRRTATCAMFPREPCSSS